MGSKEQREPSLHAEFWFPGGGDTVRPLLGKVNLFVLGKEWADDERDDHIAWRLRDF